MRNWQRILIAILAAGTLTIGASAAKAYADEIEGSWYITVHLTDPFVQTFDATYSFARGGVFVRIDGRNNAPAVLPGSTRTTARSSLATYCLTSQMGSGMAIAGKFSAQVVDGNLTGTFTADGILGLTGFHRAGTFTGIPIVAEAPQKNPSFKAGQFRLRARA